MSTTDDSLKFNFFSLIHGLDWKFFLVNPGISTYLCIVLFGYI